MDLGPAEKLFFSHPRLKEIKTGYRCSCLQTHTFEYIEMICIITKTSFSKCIIGDPIYSKFSQVPVLTVGCTDILRDASTTLIGLPS